MAPVRLTTTPLAVATVNSGSAAERAEVFAMLKLVLLVVPLQADSWPTSIILAHLVRPITLALLLSPTVQHTKILISHFTADIIQLLPGEL